MSKKATVCEVTIETFDEFEGAVDLAAEKQEELEKLQKTLKAAKAKIERSKTLVEDLKDAFVIREPKLSRQQILAAYKAGQIDDKQLKRLGLSVRKMKSLYVMARAA